MFRNYGVAKYFLIILIPLVIILGNFRYLVFNFGYYQSLYKKTGVYQSFGDSQIVDYATDNLFSYFRGKNQLDHNFFSNQAQLHLKDVKDILQVTSGIFYLSLATVLIVSIALLVKKQFRILVGSFFLSSIIILVTMIFLGLGLFQFFDPLFLKFHQVAFTNNLWLFPHDDNLIRLFPQQFFIYFANSLSRDIIFSSLAIASISAILVKKLAR